MNKTQVAVLLQNKEKLKKLYLEGGFSQTKIKFSKIVGFAVNQGVFSWLEAWKKIMPISELKFKEKH